MDEIAIQGQTNGRAVTPRAGRELPEPKKNGATTRGPEARRERLEKLIAEAVARQSETIAQTVVERIVAEIARRDESRQTFRVEDSDPIDRIPLPARHREAARFEEGVTLVHPRGAHVVSAMACAPFRLDPTNTPTDAPTLAKTFKGSKA